MAEKKVRVLIWILIGSCVLNLVLAFNAGQKRKTAVSRVDDLNAKLTELDLRYKNAAHSYDAVEKKLEEARDEIQQQQLFTQTLKETLQQEQKKSQALADELEKLKSRSSAEAVNKNNSAAARKPPPAPKKKDRSTTKAW